MICEIDSGIILKWKVKKTTKSIIHWKYCYFMGPSPHGSACIGIER